MDNDTRTVIILWVWVTYLLATIAYFVTFELIPPIYSKTINLTSSALTLFYVSYDILKGFKHETHKAFLALVMFSIALNILYVLAFHLFGFNDYKFKICTFITIEIITACFVFISGNHRGLFKNERGML